MAGLTPFLLFDGNCAEAMEFYRDCFGGELEITRLGDTPMHQWSPDKDPNLVAHARLHGEFVDASATDWNHPTRSRLQGNNVAMYLSGSNEQLTAWFTALRAGADPELIDELRSMPFGTYGHLADRFGVHWFFTSTRD